ncbi:hypothetical protein Dimus_010624 [Dionaea muscipula]
MSVQGRTRPCLDHGLSSTPLCSAYSWRGYHPELGISKLDTKASSAFLSLTHARLPCMAFMCSAPMHGWPEIGPGGFSISMGVCLSSLSSAFMGSATEQPILREIPSPTFMLPSPCSAVKVFAAVHGEAEVVGLVGARRAHAWLPLYALLRSAVVQLLHEVKLGRSCCRRRAYMLSICIAELGQCSYLAYS